MSKTARQTRSRLKMLESFLDRRRGKIMTPFENNPVRPIPIWEWKVLSFSVVDIIYSRSDSILSLGMTLADITFAHQTTRHLVN